MRGSRDFFQKDDEFDGDFPRGKGKKSNFRKAATNAKDSMKKKKKSKKSAKRRNFDESNDKMFSKFKAMPGDDNPMMSRW